MICDVKFLKAVDGNPVGRIVRGVERDEMIEKWEKMGLLSVSPAEGAQESRENGPTAAEGPVPSTEAHHDDTDAPVDVEAPTASARKSEWAEFLAEQGVDVPADATKAEMIEAWESRG